MKVIVRKNTGESLHSIPDHVSVVLQSDMTRVGNPDRPMFNGHDYYICDCTTENAELHENVQLPDGWLPHKFMFDGTTWTVDANWVDPTPEPAPAPAQG